MQKKDNPFLKDKLKEFGGKLRDIRLHLGLSQEELALELGVKRQTLSSWEAASTAPDIGDLLQVKELAKDKLPIDLGELLGEVRWDQGKTPFAFSIRFLQTMEAVGIRNAYSNRADALSGFFQALEKEAGSISVVCSSFMGLIRVAPQRVSQLLKQKAKIVKFQILMTHPDFSELREQQEVRASGSIRQEIWESYDVLTKEWGIDDASIMFYRGAPTVFMLFTPERMLINPYTYNTEAFKTMTLEVVRTQSSEDIYSQYRVNHFERSWHSKNCVHPRNVPRIPVVPGGPARGHSESVDMPRN